MSAEQLWDTTMNPDTRRLLPVQLGDLGFDDTVTRMTMLMGKGEAASRRSWLEEKGNEVEVDICRHRKPKDAPEPRQRITLEIRWTISSRTKKPRPKAKN